MYSNSAVYEEFSNLPYFSGMPLTAYMIATIPRSGSTLFSTTLWKSGHLGCPLDYINFTGVKRMRRRFSQKNISFYWDSAQKHRSSPNGVFGFKAFIPDFVNVAQECPELLPLLTPQLLRDSSRSFQTEHPRPIYF